MTLRDRLQLNLPLEGRALFCFFFRVRTEKLENNPMHSRKPPERQGLFEAVSPRPLALRRS
ncbi:hypothetical protein ABIC09_002521 [Bradyrhizobium sp. S3.12.5]